MLFSSMTFIFLFLPLLCIMYLGMAKLFPKTKYKNYLLLLASIFFYAWGEPRYVVIMLATIAINYIGALCLGRFSNHKKTVLTLTILLNLSFLIYFKYFNFIVDNLNILFTSEFNVIQVVMPIGISFYKRFQLWSQLSPWFVLKTRILEQCNGRFVCFENLSGGFGQFHLTNICIMFETCMFIRMK